MTTYVIGDLQGCLTPLQRLLEKIRFDPGCDKLWFVGDLVNRGPESLQSLRFVRGLGNSAITVLGNHDLHLLAVFHKVRKASGKDTLDDILAAPDRSELINWLCRRPLLHTDETLGYTLVHAGIHPQWTLKKATRLADELHQALATNTSDFLQHMYGNTPTLWSEKLGTRKRRRFAINAFTRMRYCKKDGSLEFDYKGAPARSPAGLFPWYATPGRKALDTCVVFGHWSSHPAMGPPCAIPIDRGCVWGGCLTALAIEPGNSAWVDCS